ncbi:Trafficking protein particle complex subunit 5 [Homalodisca vitripennis]|nr:Trafficking protein particle complex subunit 5 [Homalodisca vitripennis]
MGQDVGIKLIDLYFVREKNCKRETKLLNMLLFVKTTLWKGLFGKEADKLEHANDDERIYYIIEKEPLVNKFISVPKDKGSLNCAIFIAGIIEAVLNTCGFTPVYAVVMAIVRQLSARTGEQSLTCYSRSVRVHVIEAPLSCVNPSNYDCYELAIRPTKAPIACVNPPNYDCYELAISEDQQTEAPIACVNPPNYDCCELTVRLLSHQYVLPREDMSSNSKSVAAGNVLVARYLAANNRTTAKVTAHWHKGTTYMVQFDEAVIARDKQMEER